MCPHQLDGIISDYTILGYMILNFLSFEYLDLNPSYRDYLMPKCLCVNIYVFNFYFHFISRMNFYQLFRNNRDFGFLLLLYLEPRWAIQMILAMPELLDTIVQDSAWLATAYAWRRIVHVSTSVRWHYFKVYNIRLYDTEIFKYLNLNPSYRDDHNSEYSAIRDIIHLVEENSKGSMYAACEVVFLAEYGPSRHFRRRYAALHSTLTLWEQPGFRFLVDNSDEQIAHCPGDESVACISYEPQAHMAQILGENRLTCYGCKLSFVAGSPMMHGTHVIWRSCPALRQISHPERGDIARLHCRRPPKPKSDFLASYLNICVWCGQEPFCMMDTSSVQLSCTTRRHYLHANAWCQIFRSPFGKM